VLLHGAGEQKAVMLTIPTHTSHPPPPQNTLTVVNIDTASGSRGGEGGGGHELTLSGLKDPHAFKKMYECGEGGGGGGGRTKK
jgi:hypothetical protein